MNVLKGSFVFVLLFFLSFSLVYSSSYCGVSFDEPYFKVNNSLGEIVLLIDNNGDGYLKEN